MTSLTMLDPKTVAQRVNDGQVVLIDIREPDEHAREHIKGAISLPMSSLDQSELKFEADQHVVFHCKSGMRTEANCDRLSQFMNGDAYLLQGGLDAWREEDLPTVISTSAPLEINRQVQITAGGLVVLGVLLGATVHPTFFGLSLFVGAGLTFAGISGWCGMAKILARMPWNRRRILA
jgi:rhodanese-related sulfurtransferase